MQIFNIEINCGEPRLESVSKSEYKLIGGVD